MRRRQEPQADATVGEREQIRLRLHPAEEAVADLGPGVLGDQAVAVTGQAAGDDERLVAAGQRVASAYERWALPDGATPLTAYVRESLDVLRALAAS